LARLEGFVRTVPIYIIDETPRMCAIVPSLFKNLLQIQGTGCETVPSLWNPSPGGAQWDALNWLEKVAEAFAEEGHSVKSACQVDPSGTIRMQGMDTRPERVFIGCDVHEIETFKLGTRRQFDSEPDPVFGLFLGLICDGLFENMIDLVYSIL
jgi:hypothetical protein